MADITKDLSHKTAKEVLNEIGPVSAHLIGQRPQNGVVEAFPRNGIAGKSTYIVFSAEDPLKKHELLLNGKRNVTLMISSDFNCDFPHDIQLIVTKRPFTSKSWKLI